MTRARADSIVALCHVDDFCKKKRSWPASFCPLTATIQQICIDQLLFEGCNENEYYGVAKKNYLLLFILSTHLFQPKDNMAFFLINIPHLISLIGNKNSFIDSSLPKPCIAKD